uniref:Evasin n=1 Tax=Rhipicephalus microplus TaxID=6941 RepID=A0A6G5A458_RHIMP|nr:evasin-1-like [Rhipicephalus microplus]
MVFKAFITVLAAVYVIQMVCKAHGNSEEDMMETTTEFEYEAGACPFQVLKISNNKSLIINCTNECGYGLSDGEPCVNATNPPLNFTVRGDYNCTVGSCRNGTCPSNGTVEFCWANKTNSEKRPSARSYSVQLY